MKERHYKSDKDGYVYMASMRPNVRIEYARIVDDFFEDSDLKKGATIIRWAIQGIAKDREISPFLQARLLIDAGGIADDELEQLYELIGKELEK